MVVYSIKDIENLSGIKAHTLRIWEKRYQIIQPKRTNNNIRYYTDEDLRHLLNVCYLYNKGHKISKIAKMTEPELKNAVTGYSSIYLDQKDKVDTLLIFILEFDAYNLNKVIDQHLSQKGLEDTMLELIYPLLDKLSMSWLSGSFQAVHESFVTQILKLKIQACIESLSENKKDSPFYLIYLPESENQELSILYLHYLLKKNKCKVLNLGLDISLQDLVSSLELIKPDYIFTIINEALKNLNLQNYIDQVCQSMGHSMFLLTGYQTVAQQIKKQENIIVLKNLDESLNFIRSSKSL